MPAHIVKETSGVPIKIWSRTIEAEALTQLENTARLPFVFKHAAAMPDAHAGKGATVKLDD